MYYISHFEILDRWLKKPISSSWNIFKHFSFQICLPVRRHCMRNSQPTNATYVFPPFKFPVTSLLFSSRVVSQTTPLFHQESVNGRGFHILCLSCILKLWICKLSYVKLPASDWSFISLNGVLACVDSRCNINWKL